MTRKRNFIKQTEGATAIIIACSLFALIAVASLSIDMGHLYTVRNELQNVADAAALAGVGQLIQQDANLNAVWNSDLAQQTAIQVAQDQRKLQFPLEQAVAAGDRDDLAILFGTWNDRADPSLAWAPTTVKPNAMRVTITRGDQTIYGPVTSIFAKAIGSSSSTVVASATAYLGYTNEVQTGGVQVPLALPATGTQSPLASNGRSGWFASLFGPQEAVASNPQPFKFRDTGGANVTVGSDKKLSAANAAADANQPYFYKNRSADVIPKAINYPMQKVATPSFTSDDPTHAPVVMRDMKVGDQIWPGSEYRYQPQMAEMFGYLKAAYDKKKINGTWSTTLVVHGLLNTSSLPQKTGFMSLARLLAPFWPSEAFACVPVQPPTLSAKTFVKVDITAVTSGTGDYGASYIYPKTIATPVPTIPNPISGQPATKYNDQKDFLNRFPNSTWNVNIMTYTVATNTNTVSPPGSLSGGPSSNNVNPNAPTNVGTYSRTARLVK